MAWFERWKSWDNVLALTVMLVGCGDEAGDEAGGDSGASSGVTVGSTSSGGTSADETASSASDGGDATGTGTGTGSGSGCHAGQTCAVGDCYAPDVSGAGCIPSCTVGAGECGEGMVCSWVTLCPYMPHTECLPPCEEGTCDEGYGCDVGTGACLPLSCPEQQTCDGNHTCEPVSPDPTDLGCVRKQCSTNADCADYCVLGRCFDVPGQCLDQPPA